MGEFVKVWVRERICVGVLGVRFVKLKWKKAVRRWSGWVDTGSMTRMTGTNEYIEMDSVDTEPAIDECGIIPFADEVAMIDDASSVADEQAVDAQDLGETANDEFGDTLNRRSVVDADLGLDDEAGVRSSKGKYACPCCGSGARRVIRVRVSGDPELSQARWVALCAVCAASMLAKVPGTIVGGSVRPSMRRSKRQNKRALRKQQQALRDGSDAGFRRAS